MFTNKDGYVEGGIEIETTNPTETQGRRSSRSRKNFKREKKEQLSGTNMAWFSLAKIALQAGGGKFMLTVKRLKWLCLMHN